MRKTTSLASTLSKRLPEPDLIRSMYEPDHIGAIHVKGVLTEKARRRILGELRRCNAEGRFKGFDANSQMSVYVGNPFPGNNGSNLSIFPEIYQFAEEYLNGIHNPIGDIIGFGQIGIESISMNSIFYPSSTGALNRHRDSVLNANLIGIFSIAGSGVFSLSRPDSHDVSFNVEPRDLVLLRAYRMQDIDRIKDVIQILFSEQELDSEGYPRPNHSVSSVQGNRYSLVFRDMTSVWKELRRRDVVQDDISISIF